MAESDKLTDELKREIGQHFVFGFHGHEPSEEIIRLIREYHVGNIIIFKRNIQSIPQLHALIQSLQKIAKDSGQTRPLLIGIDQENGLVSAFSSTPKSEVGAMAIGNTGSEELAEQIAAATGHEMRLVGINWVYSPVADVNSDVRNPVIGVRSFGEDPEAVSSFVRSVCSGLSSAGIAPCSKHFPGHGDTHVDSHLALPVITKDLQTMEKTELVPFRVLIDHGIDSIMTGHIALPLLVKSLNSEADPNTPASLSREISTTLLRELLAYSGLIVTDCLEMNAISETYGCGPGALLALLAGADIVMVCHRLDRQIAAIEAVYDAVQKGQLNYNQLKLSGERIATLKDKFGGGWDHALGNNLDIGQFNQLRRRNEILSKHAYALSTRWITEQRTLISQRDDVLILTPRMEFLNAAVDDPEGLQRNSDGSIRNAAGPSYISFATAVARRAPFSSHIVYSSLTGSSADFLLESIQKSTLSIHTVIFATRNAHQASSRWQIDVLKEVIRTTRDKPAGTKQVKVIVVATCAPYDLHVLEEDVDTKALPCICTYEFTRPALESAVSLLYGERVDPKNQLSDYDLQETKSI